MVKVVISGGTVLSPAGEWLAADVLIAGTAIEDVIPRDGSLEPDGTRVIDATGKWLIPGLIDAHVHICFSIDNKLGDPQPQSLIKGVRNARVNLLAGETTVRDCGAMGKLNIELRKAIDAGVVPGPRIVACGEFIAMTGGHVYYWAKEADGPDEVRKAAREQLKAGANFIKLMASGGAAAADESPQSPQLTQEEMAAACREARAVGAKVSVHAHGEEAMLSALNAGANSLEHATYLTPAVIDKLVEKKAAVVPTFCVYETIAADGRLPEAQREIARRVVEVKTGPFLEAVRAGVVWGVGTDEGSYYPPGAVVAEMMILNRIGLSAKDVLLAATRTNSGILGVEKLVGTIEPGKKADIVLLDGDPMVDLGVLKTPSLVMKDGVVYLPGR